MLGGDGRFFNYEAIQVILRLAAANNIARVLVGRDGLVDTGRVLRNPQSTVPRAA